MPKFGTVASVKAGVPDATFKRAREIVTSSKLQNVLFEGDLLQKGTALCQGSNPGESYKVTISVDQDTSAFPTGHCSCPVRGSCKHAVALLLKRVEELIKLEQAGGGVSTNGASSSVKQEMSPPSAVTTAANDMESASLKEPRVLQSVVEVVALSAGLRILPAWMTKSAKQETEEEKPAKRVAAPRKPLPAAKRKRGTSTKIEEDEEDDEAEPTRTMGRRIKDHEDEGNVEAEAPKRSRGRKKAIQEDELEEHVGNGLHHAEYEEVEHVPQPRHRRLRRGGNVKRQGEEEDEVRPSSKRTRGRSTKIEEDEEESEAEPTRTMGRRIKTHEDEDNVEAEAPKRARGRKQAIQEDEVEEYVGNDAEDEEVEHVPQLRHRRLRRGGNVKRQGEDGDEVSPSSPVQKRGRRSMRVENEESDLSDKDVATEKADRSDKEVVTETATKGPTAGGGLDLTAEDLLRFAHEHLDGDMETKDGDTQLIAEAEAPKTKKKSSSIFCSSQWQDPVSQDYPASVYRMPVEATEIVQTIPTLKIVPSTQVPESIVNDMLGIFLPPLKGEREKISTVNSTDLHDSAPTKAPADIGDTSEVEPKAKKKSSLKDRVMLYL